MKKKYAISIFSKTQIVFLAGLAVVMLIILTISNGRVSGGENQFLSAINSIIDRVMFVNQGSALTCFSYIEGQETVWGYDWFKMFEQLLPGASDYIPIDNISYQIEYGTLAGTNPPCLWGSAWYNFSFFGITIFPLIMGIMYHNVYKTFARKVNKDRLYSFFYVALCVYLGVWTYGTPMSLFNWGVVAVLLMRWLIYGIFKKGKGS